MFRETYGACVSTCRSTKPFTAVTMANVVSVVFAAPLAAGIMSITALGLAGWQWLFILEGIPSVMLGAVMLVSLSTPISWCDASAATE